LSEEPFILSMFSFAFEISLKTLDPINITKTKNRGTAIILLFLK
jgi:hypothetical protein